MPELIVRGREEKLEFETAAGTFGIDYLGVWLFFSVFSQYFKEQISGTATDRIDILNALKGPETVLFYPDYENQPSTSYSVKSVNSATQLLRTQKGLFKAEQRIDMRAVSRVSNYPTWLKYK